MTGTLAGLWSSGTPFVWLTGGTLALCLLMIGGLLVLVLFRGLGAFWPAPLAEVRLDDGTALLGEIWERETIPDPDAAEGATRRERILLRVGNRDFYGTDFRWVDEDRIRSVSYPRGVLTIERQEWGNFYGVPVSVHRGEEALAEGPGEIWRRLGELMPGARKLRARIRTLEREDIGEVNARIEEARLEVRALEIRGDADPRRTAALEARIAEAKDDYASLERELEELYAKMRSEVVMLREIGGQEKSFSVAEIVRAFDPNDMSLARRIGVYLSRMWEFVSGEPRESNTEGGIFPAIFGTCLMVILMSLAVVPFGVLTAIYLHEYAVQGPLVRTVRIAVNNLAGVPSIVFGVFGLGFFIYFVGGSIDHLLFPERLPTPTYGTGGILWASLTLALLTVPVVIVATEEALSAIAREVREGSLALGATQWETIRRVLLPAAAPGILTGMILAMARGAGEVAPLMITGVVKLAPTLPLDGQWPFLHLDRKFMHLGFHIYDVGFQSPNVEAAKPMVYSTTLLLLAVVLLINVLAIWLRNRLRRRHRHAGV
ncbi:MAG: phosphate ABC transporter permease PstA [Candidatus Binatia bacterium]